jgi:hypothetical protein
MQKYKFDARAGQTAEYSDLYANPWKYSFVHNFKVHFKVSIIQALANKVDISISSTTPQIPTMQQVMDEFNQRMQLGNAAQQRRVRFSAASYHVTNIEYKESFAFYDPNMARQAPPQVQAVSAPMGSSEIVAGSAYCRSCGARMSADSRFCAKCGTAVTG